MEGELEATAAVGASVVEEVVADFSEVAGCFDDKCDASFDFFFFFFSYFFFTRVIKINISVCRGEKEKRVEGNGEEGGGNGKAAYLLPSPQRSKTVKEADILK